MHSETVQLPVVVAQVVRKHHRTQERQVFSPRGLVHPGIELSLEGNRLMRRSAGQLQQSFHVSGEVLKVAFCRFQGDREKKLCILQPKLLTVHSNEGTSDNIPLASHFTDMFPLKLGLILAGAKDSPPRILLLPTEDLQSVPTELKNFISSSRVDPIVGWGHEHVVWVGGEESPFALTYNKKAQQLRLWLLKEGPPSSQGHTMDGNFRTPQQAKVQRQAVSSPASGSGLKRPSIRMPNGALSPAAFSPAPQPVGGVHLPPVVLLPGPTLPMTVVLVAEERVPEEKCPNMAVAFHDLDGSCLLAMLSETMSCAAVIRLPTADTPISGAFEAVFECQANAIVGISRGPLSSQQWSEQQDDSGPRQKNLLVLGCDGELRLYAGAGLGFSVGFNSSDPELYDRLTNAVPPPRGPELEVLAQVCAEQSEDQKSVVPSDSDADMESVLADSLADEPQPIMALEAAGDGQVILVFKSSKQQICCNILPPSGIICAAFEALRHVLSPQEICQFLSRLHGLHGSHSQSPVTQWEAFSEAVLDLATGSAAQRLKHDSDSCCVRLMRSHIHRLHARCGQFEWMTVDDSHLEATPALPTPSNARLQVLHVLHALYEDAKLDIHRSTWLLDLGVLLANLSVSLGASEYLDHYTRDLGAFSLPIAKMPATGNAAPLEPPADILAALYALLTGQPADPWVSPLLYQQPEFLHRTLDVLHFYTLLAEIEDDERSEWSREQTTDGPLFRDVQGNGITASMQKRHHLVLEMVDRGWDQPRLNSLPYGIALPLRQVILPCQRKPPSGWRVEAYQLIGREDIVANLGDVQGVESCKASKTLPNDFYGGNLRTSMPTRTPMLQPQLRTPAPGGHVRSRMSMGGDPVIAAAAAAAVATPVQVPPKASKGSKLRKSHCLPYEQRLHLAGVDWDPYEGADNGKTRKTADGTEALDAVQKKQRFGPDLRLMEVAKLLQSSLPTAIHIKNASVAGEAEQSALQQKRIMALAVRTMALPTGRAALSLGTLNPLPTEPLKIPEMNLAGLLPEQQNAVVKLDLTATTPAPGGGASADFTAWPEFHNGVAAGLRLAPGGAQLTRTWIVYNKPKEPSYTHAGMLMGLGLTGHLNCLAATDLYRYLSQEHDATTAGVLLGMAAAKRGTSDATISKMLFLHVPTRHPVAYPELELSPLVQSAALMGVGLLFQGSCHRLTAEIMLEEIGRRPNMTSSKAAASAATISSSGTTISADREGYALSAGLALGLICLGHGRNCVGLADMRIEDRLRYYMVGGKDPRLSSRSGKHLETTATISTATVDTGAIGFDPTQGGEMPWTQPGISPRDHRSVPTAPQGQSQLVIEGNIANLDVTAPGATLALGLMYLKTNDTSIADSFAVPSTHFDLDFVRPDFILLRVLARALVMWDSVEPNEEWLIGQLPPLIQGPLDAVGWPSHGSEGDSKVNLADLPEDPEAVAQAHVNAVTGGCLAIGIRFAGTADPTAAATLEKYVRIFLKAKLEAPDPFSGAAAVWGRLDKQTLENCMDVIAIALSLVMAGTGDEKALKLLRGLRRRLSQGEQNTAGAVFFGNHMAISMALGFLFYGAGSRTFSTSKPAIAALIISLFPRFPLSPTDNRCHLQIFRHLHVLASQARLVEAMDIDTQEQVSDVPLKIRQTAGAVACSQRPARLLRTPCLVPDFDSIEQLEVPEPTEEHQSEILPLSLRNSDPGLAEVLGGGRIYVQQRRSREDVLRVAAELFSSWPEVHAVPGAIREAAGAKHHHTYLKYGGLLEALISLHALDRSLKERAGGDLASVGPSLAAALWNLKLAALAVRSSPAGGFSASRSDQPLLPSKLVERVLHEAHELLQGRRSKDSVSQSVKTYLHSFQLAGTDAEKNCVGAYLAVHGFPGPGSLDGLDVDTAVEQGEASSWLTMAAKLSRHLPETVQALSTVLNGRPCSV